MTTIYLALFSDTHVIPYITNKVYLKEHKEIGSYLLRTFDRN